jgi:hypothetical protein
MSDEGSSDEGSSDEGSLAAAALQESVLRLTSRLEQIARRYQSGRSCDLALDCLPRAAIAPMDTPPSGWIEVFTDESWQVCMVAEDAPALVAGASSLLLGCESSLLLLLCGPQQYTLWNKRKHFLQRSPTDATLRASLLLQELCFSALLLSRAHKVGDIWQHRFWVWKRLREVEYQSAGSLLCGQPLHEAMARLDRGVLRKACDAHPMNLNAWQYRRNMWVLQCEALIATGRVDLFFESFLSEVGDVIHFCRLHHGDASCCSYLLFLIGGPWWRRMGEGGAHIFHCRQQVWSQLLSLTTSMLTTTAHRGHESLWHLRLGLIHEALNCSAPFSTGGWTVADELRFAWIHCGGGEELEAAAGVPEAVDDGSPEQLHWAQCNGGLRWHQYYAAKYGLQLTAMLLAV